METYPRTGLLVEAEAFHNFGGWTLDSQFELIMGSPYLLAHGNGRPVADATTQILIRESGSYRVWLRTKDWVPGHHPGKFQLLVNGRSLPVEFGANDQDWNWEFGGNVDLSAGEVSLALHDLTGFCGRCDAIFLTLEDTSPPNLNNEKSASWRRRLRGISDTPENAGTYDVVVVGGGFVGSAAALVAARLGQKVALIQDRPVLGGNSSVEIGLSPRGLHGPLVKELMKRHRNGDLVAKQLLDAELGATVWLNHVVFNATTRGDTIVAVDAREARSGREIRVSGSTFIDCTGKAIFGALCRAETMSGQESRSQFGESLAPVRGDDMHHGNTVFFRTKMAEKPVSFPSVPWAVEVAKDFADLGGQLITPGYENGPGPSITPGHYLVDPSAHPRMRRSNTHYWEYGQWLNPYTQAELIRDHLLRAIYGTFSNVKTFEREKYANLELDWVAFVPGQGEFNRYRGPVVLSEPDIRSHRAFEDGVVQNGSAFCLHYPSEGAYSFRLKHWIWDERDGKPFDIPFRCLYSNNISNLMMAGKHISVTHVAGSCTKLMGNGAQHAICTAAAAALCNKYGTTPAGVYEHHLAELHDTVKPILQDGSNRSSKL